MRRLIIRPGAIGDCILSLPAIEFLKTGYTEVWAPGPVLPLLRGFSCTRSIVATGLDVLELPGRQPSTQLIERLQSFDSIVSWYGAGRPEFCAALLQINPKSEFLAALPGPTDREHCADFFARQVGAPTPAIPRIHCPPSEPADYAVIHPFSGSLRKNWPLERYRELAQRLPFPVRWCAGPDEPLEGAVRFDDLFELGCWLAGAQLYIGNDSGITHLAAAVGAPVVAMFDPTDPAMWGPRGEHVRIVNWTEAADPDWVPTLP